MKVARREVTVLRTSPWPFLYSVTAGQLRRNVSPPASAQKDLKKKAKKPLRSI